MSSIPATRAAIRPSKSDDDESSEESDESEEEDEDGEDGGHEGHEGREEKTGADTPKTTTNTTVPVNMINTVPELQKECDRLRKENSAINEELKNCQLALETEKKKPKTYNFPYPLTIDSTLFGSLNTIVEALAGLNQIDHLIKNLDENNTAINGESDEQDKPDNIVISDPVIAEKKRRIDMHKLMQRKLENLERMKKRKEFFDAHPSLEDKFYIERPRT
ncbi:MAG: hypothetical protein Faunusvirus1_34 [Faunusvirus sp.]|uniref:Uncharacterized protein n=1 Tax=Faunusvirus sp. TaxID=2487766 RepID=A0A3G4ZXE5_9VIRU|nr:MAG: hypothetical protein Faunusvirus1_34 [Faunusvirus sp.]